MHEFIHKSKPLPLSHQPVSQFAFNLDRLLAALIINGVKVAQARLYPGTLRLGPIYTGH